MKILAFSSTRADYDLLSSLYIKFKNNNHDIRIVVSGAHLTKKFGNSVNEIKRDGLKILATIKSLKKSDRKIDQLISASNLLNLSIKKINLFKPDIILYAGDREDALIAALISIYLKIPSIHFYGGDHVQSGHADDTVRHAISKLATYHFVSTKEHKHRLIAIGEDKKRITNIGSIALDRIYKHKKFSTKRFENIFNFYKKNKNYALIIFHPMEEKGLSIVKIIKIIAEYLTKKNIFLTMLYPNSDPGNEAVINAIKLIEKKFNAVTFKYLNRHEFIELYRRSRFIIGNSSSIILESTSLKIPAISIGDRQKNRLASENVLFVKLNESQIKNAVNKALSKKFNLKVRKAKSLYGDGQSTLKAYKKILDLNKKDHSNLIYKIDDPLENIK